MHVYLMFCDGCGVFHSVEVPQLIYYFSLDGYLVILNIDFCEQCCSEPPCTCVLVHVISVG